MMLGIIKRNFVYISRNCFVTLYKSLVRSHLEYANSVWYPKHYILVVLSLFLRNRGLWRPASVFSMWHDVMYITYCVSGLQILLIWTDWFSQW